MQNSSKIWLSSPHMGGTEQNYIKEAFDNNWVAPLGANVTNFEIQLEKYLGQNASVAALSAGTAALHLGLVLLGVGAGDYVICQSMTFSASANPIMYLGATPVFIDSEKDTWNLDPVQLENAILDLISKNQKPKAIIAVHLYGIPYQIEAIQSISDKYQIPILEDSAEALGSIYKGQKCGTFGHIAALSFNGNKIITTSGGGALVAKDVETKEKAVFLATQARDAAPHYQHSHVGYNYRLSNICAGIGCGQMEVLDNHVSARNQMHNFYLNLFHDVPGITVFDEKRENVHPNYWLTTILINPEKTKNNKNRDDIRIFLESKNIECRPLWKPLHLQPIFENHPYYGNKVAEDLFEIGLCVPSGSNLNQEDKQRIKDAFLEILG